MRTALEEILDRERYCVPLSAGIHSSRLLPSSSNERWRGVWVTRSSDSRHVGMSVDTRSCHPGTRTRCWLGWWISTWRPNDDLVGGSTLHVEKATVEVLSKTWKGIEAWPIRLRLHHRAESLKSEKVR